MLTLQDDHVSSEHFNEMSGFLALDNPHLDGSPTQVLIINPGSVDSTGSSLVNGAALSLPEVEDVAAVTVAVEDHIAVTRVEKPLVSLLHLHQLHLLNSPDRLAPGTLVRHKSEDRGLMSPDT